MTTNPEDIATEDLAIAKFAVAISSAHHDNNNDDGDDDDDDDDDGPPEPLTVLGCALFDFAHSG